MTMTEAERLAAVKTVLPDTVNGNIRPTDPIPTDFPFSTSMRQLISQDPNKYTIFNMLMRQILSNDYLLNIALEAVKAASDSNTALLFVKRSTTYSVGNVRFHKLLPINEYLECTTAGTTSSGEPESIEVTPGSNVTDGTSVWIVRQIVNTTQMVIATAEPSERPNGSIWIQVVSEED